MGKSKSVIVGYKYYLGAHLVFCHGPVDKLTAVAVDNKSAWSGTCTGGQIVINAPSLFGGEKREGGVVGAVDIDMGSPSQGQNGYLVSRLGGGVPAYRGVVGAILNQCYVGLNPYLKTWKFRFTRIFTSSHGSSQWYSAKAGVNTWDMNPAHILRECLLDPDWGMGYNAYDIDDASFMAAADTLYDEGMGISIMWDRQMPIEDFIKEIIRHIDGSIYVDRITGKFKLTLIRGGYSVGSLPTLDENSIIEVSDFTCPTFGELTNSVTVNYWDLSTGTDASLTVQDIALTQMQGAVINTTVQYPGFSNGTLASKVASRDLRALSTPVIRCTIQANRSAAGLNVGDVFKLTWPDFGVADLVMRVGQISLGGDLNGKVSITAVQDVFSMGTAVYAPPSASEWVSPVNPPTAVTYQLALEAPYWELVQRKGQTDVDTAITANPTLGYLLAAGVRPTSDAINATLRVDSGGGYDSGLNIVDFCPTSTTTGVVSPTATTINFSNPIDMDLVVTGTTVQIDNEMMYITGVSSSSITVKRGVLDTVPVQHGAGARLYFWDLYGGTDGVEYVSGEVITEKLLTTTGLGTLDISVAPSTSVTMAQRANRPYPPGQFNISGSYFPTSLTDVALTLSWAHRNRLQQTSGTMYGFLDGSIGPEAGVTYSINLINDTTSTVLYSVTGLTGTSHSGFPTMTGTYTLRLELWSVRGGLASLYKQSHVFSYTNTGLLTTEDAAGHLLTEASDTLITE